VLTVLAFVAAQALVVLLQLDGMCALQPCPVLRPYSACRVFVCAIETLHAFSALTVDGSSCSDQSSVQQQQQQQQHRVTSYELAQWPQQQQQLDARTSVNTDAAAVSISRSAELHVRLRQQQAQQVRLLIL
jgi:hypothetical protein